jgi:hypothetical protein
MCEPGLYFQEVINSPKSIITHLMLNHNGHYVTSLVNLSISLFNHKTETKSTGKVTQGGGQKKCSPWFFRLGAMLTTPLKINTVTEPWRRPGSAQGCSANEEVHLKTHK